MTVRARLTIVALLALLGTSAAIVLPTTAAQAAKPSTDLAIQLANTPDTRPGEKVTYIIFVFNKGQAAAKHMDTYFTTSAALRHIAYKISQGHCHPSPKRIMCNFGTVKPGTVAIATLTGMLPIKLKPGATVTNKVTVRSRTKLINKADDVATDSFRIGVPATSGGLGESGGLGGSGGSGAPKVAAPAAPVAPSSSPTDKITKFTNTAGKVFDLSRAAVNVTFAVLAAAIGWFVVGLTRRHRSRVKRGITDDY